jgi:hypothetical protein
MTDKSQGEQSARPLHEQSEQPDARAWAPWMVLELDVASGFPELVASGPDRKRPQGAWILIRAFSEPLGSLWMPFEDGFLSASAIRDAIPSDVATQIRLRLEDAGITWSGEIPLAGCDPKHQPSFLASREQLIREGPAVTVVVCTRDRPDELRRCIASWYRCDKGHSAIINWSVHGLVRIRTGTRIIQRAQPIGERGGIRNYCLDRRR